MKVKEIELRSAANKSKIGSTAFTKHSILKDLLNKFDALIDRYNNNPKKNRSTNDELAEINFLLLDFMFVIGRLTQNQIKVICKPRDKNRENLNKLMHFGSMGLTTVAGTVVGGPLLGFGLLVSTAVASNVTREKTGISDVTPKTGRLLMQFIKNVDDILEGTNDYWADTDLYALSYQTKWTDSVLDESKINSKTLYMYIKEPLIECVYKDSKGVTKKHVLTDLLDQENLEVLYKQAEIGFVQRSAIAFALYKSITSPMASIKEVITDDGDIEEAEQFSASL